MLDSNQPTTSTNVGGSTPLYDEVSEEERPRDPRVKKRTPPTQTTGAPPEKIQIRNAGTIFMTVSPGNDVMFCKPNQSRPWAILTAAGNFITL